MITIELVYEDPAVRRYRAIVNEVPYFVELDMRYFKEAPKRFIDSYVKNCFKNDIKIAMVEE